MDFASRNRQMGQCGYDCGPEQIVVFGLRPQERQGLEYVVRKVRNRRAHAYDEKRAHVEHVHLKRVRS
jgi:hypothetical protein